MMDPKEAQKIATESVRKKMDEIYNDIADTLVKISGHPKYDRMTGPEALRYAASLIRRAPKDAEK